MVLSTEDKSEEKMITFVDQVLEDYAVDHSGPLPLLMEELRRFTSEHMELPQMQVGPLEGMLLKVLARLVRARRILEVGTFTGYSGLMMACALPEDGELITCELEEKNARVARRFFDKSGHGAKIKIERGPAMETLSTLEGPFDMAFIDADKVNYIHYFDLILPMMREGGVIVADNVLWSGRVLGDEAEWDESTRALAAFNQHVRRHAELDRVMLTVRDGMTLIVT